MKRVTTHLFLYNRRGRRMASCESFDSFVTDDSVWVFSRPDRATVQVCQQCEEIISDGTEARQARAKRR